jgi:hypothetical protein
MALSVERESGIMFLSGVSQERLAEVMAFNDRRKGYKPDAETTLQLVPQVICGLENWGMRTGHGKIAAEYISWLNAATGREGEGHRVNAVHEVALRMYSREKAADGSSVSVFYKEMNRRLRAIAELAAITADAMNEAMETVLGKDELYPYALLPQ